ncbi:MAG: PEP-CTERM sorting domain-containing protein, partial [Myxococcota bacterium]
MKKQWTQCLLALGLVALLAGPAGASLVAGWDFSDLAGDSASVPANHPANVVGTATATALNVSGDVVASTLRPGSAEADQSGLEGGINGFASRQDPTFAVGQVGFDRRGELLGLTTRGAATAAFDVSLAAPTVETWVVTFGADALTGSALESTNVTVAFGGSCAGAATIGTAVIRPGDTEVSMFLGQLASAGGCVVLSMDGSSTQPLIDNVTISTVVPEPGASLMLLAGTAGLVVAGRRRARGSPGEPSAVRRARAARRAAASPSPP